MLTMGLMGAAKSPDRCSASELRWIGLRDSRDLWSGRVRHLNDSQRVVPRDFLRQRPHFSLMGPISPIRRRSSILE